MLRAAWYSLLGRPAEPRLDGGAIAYHRAAGRARVDPEDLAIIAAFVVAYSLVSQRFARSAITGPMVFVAFGLLVGPSLLDLVDLSVENELVLTLAELTLVLVLFTDAARIDFRLLREQPAVPARLLGIGLPLTIALGALLAALLFGELAAWEAILLAAVLAPTDAALGQAVVTNLGVPLRVRQALNVESGLNDGIAAPVVSVGIAGSIAIVGFDAADSVEFAAKQIGYGLLLGVAIGGVGGWAVSLATRKGWASEALGHIAMLACALAAFWLAEVVEGNGFLAAFVGGLTLGHIARHLGEELFHFAEEEGQLLTLLTFMIFGGAFAAPLLDDLTWQIAVYAALSLTLIRMLPVALALLGLGFQRETVGFLAWFGPRGLASIVFGLLVIEAHDIAGREQIFEVVTWTVLPSVFAHGFTAEPLASWYGRLTGEMAGEPEMAAMPEMAPVGEMRVRFRMPPPDPADPPSPAFDDSI